ncbi:uncharacterized protein LOC100742996 [Bombus impatiens]|uniref:Uncharacterized protein LOC100742996 n=1 Tax=Bombus impatiens TaxID=132113 RepID=A0A6P3V3P4_BOMIM|nr:uncharacterized protein LOC100742996 [Bombus impatiens]
MCDKTITIEKMHILTVIFAGIVTLLSHVPTASSEQSAMADGQPKGAKLALSPTSSLQTETYQDSIDYYNFPIDDTYRPLQNKKCPLCDSSVYPYCGEKLLHDACCCTNPYTHDLPYQCKLADCRFLHANSCREHRLIATCCCSDDYRFLLKSFPNA